MTELAKEIHRRALELMYYIAANTTSNDEYESALSQVAIDLLDEAVAFDDGVDDLEEKLINGSWDENVSEFDPFDDTDENIWGVSSIGDMDEDDDGLNWLSDWDDDMDDEDDDDMDNDTEYRQQADGRVL